MQRVHHELLASATGNLRFPFPPAILLRQQNLVIALIRFVLVLAHFVIFCVLLINCLGFDLSCCVIDFFIWRYIRREKRCHTSTGEGKEGDEDAQEALMAKIR